MSTKKLQILSGFPQETFIVNLKKYGITAMESHAAPFTAEEYEAANNNVLGFNRAFADAYAAGYRSVVVPVGNYPVLYQNSDADRVNSGHYYSIKLQNDTEYDFSYSQIWVMFDSDSPNPYYTYSDENYYKAGGKVIGLVGNKNVEIKNLTITGDRELRSYANTSEKNLENTTGIISISHNDGITIRNVICESFMADGFAGGTAYGSKSAFAYQDYTMTQGYVDLGNGVVTANATPNNVYSDLIDVSVLAGGYANIWSGLGYQYVLDAHPTMFALFYDEEEAYIGSEMTFQSYNFYVPKNAKYIRVVFTNAFNVPNTTQSFRITSPSSQNFLLENVILRNNCRGGASNVPNFCTFRKCKFYHNGKTSYGGAPQFYDFTRYAMDIEDIQSAGVVIDDCDEYDNGNGGFFLGAIDVTISNSRLTKVSLYRGVCYHITNSLIRSLGATSNNLDSTNYFLEASNCTIVSYNGNIDLSRLSNCDIIFNGSCQISGKSIDNRIYVIPLLSYDTMYVDGDLFFTGFIKNLKNARGKVIGVKGFSKFFGDINSATQILNCEFECKDRVIYVNNDQLYENCTIKNFYSSWRNNAEATVTFKNCDIVDIVSTIEQHHYNNSSFKTVFENCTFTAAPTANNFYITSVRSFDEDTMEFVNCKFINDTEYTVYASMDSGYYKAPTFKNCTFENVTPYPSYVDVEEPVEDGISITDDGNGNVVITLGE